MNVFQPSELKKLFTPETNSNGEDNGQVTIIGGSELFHGAPLLSLKSASRIVDMVFFTSPDPSVGKVAEQVKSKLFSFIWIPWDEVGEYVAKSDAILIGPGMMRYHKEKDGLVNKENQDLDDKGKLTRQVTEHLLKKFPNKKWVIDGGSLQTMDPNWIPQNAILTPNKKEFEMLFGVLPEIENVKQMANKYKCFIVLKGPTTFVATPEEVIEVTGGNPGMTKGGTGDVQAGLTVALLAKNEPFLTAICASYIVKAAADVLHKKVGVNYNADDLADEAPVTLQKLRSEIV